MTKRKVNDRSTELPSSKEIDRSKRASRKFLLKRRTLISTYKERV